MSIVQVSNKRKRTDSDSDTAASGECVASIRRSPTPSASQPVPGPPKGQVLVNLSSFKAPAAWAFFLQDVPATNIPPHLAFLLPSPKCTVMYHSAIAGYRSSFRQYHKITTAWNRFEVESEGDSVPPAIVNFFSSKDLRSSSRRIFPLQERNGMRRPARPI
jgi:hypothetical protein